MLTPINADIWSRCLVTEPSVMSFMGDGLAFPETEVDQVAGLRRVDESREFGRDQKCL